MIKLVWGSSFKRAYKKSIKGRSDLEDKLAGTLKVFQNNSFDPILKTHKLSGRLSGLWAFVVAYDCRVIFKFVENPDTNEKEALLVDIGKHEEVY
ncbi:MAG TPA: type II toxin-antitoxin system RelE/ParE family toxin [Candidatus Avalokitesvara rifleensis]|uniref:type II toxin-antitoxin system RelE/ParE family toxin n=1 Tax=Candidatus Avalokitesvara rifleensis TaxID=3367620 RepID=UPI0027131382|nr:type II toxin-antitoxin system YafQ family toxin [Candidatus Brocadiales bacterium]